MSAPKPFPLSQFDTLVDGQPLASIMGKLVKLYPSKGGTNSVGPWTLQNAEIEQDGVTMPVCFKDRPELDQSWRNKVILVTAQKDKSLTGVYCWDDDRTDPKIRKIKITATATIDIVNADSAPAAHQPAPTPTQGQTSTNKEAAPNLQDPAPSKPPTQNSGPPPKRDRTREDQEFIDARKTLLQIANLHLLCALTVDRYEAPAYKALTTHEMDLGQRQAAIASIFIKADREGLVKYMPTVDARNDPRFQEKKDD